MKNKKQGITVGITAGVIAVLLVLMALLILLPEEKAASLMGGNDQKTESTQTEESSAESAVLSAAWEKRVEAVPFPEVLPFDEVKKIIPEPEISEEELEAIRLEEERQRQEEEAALEAERNRLEQEARRLQGFETVLDRCESRSGILVRLRDDYLGGVVAEKNVYEELAPASMTKMLTALISAEMCADDLDQLVTMPEGIFYDLDEVDASRSLLYEGETVTARDMLYGILLPSGCDCCLAMAYYLGGSEEGFAELMNQKAEELGLTNSHFITCSGLYVEGHYSCASDMAKIARACYENPIIHEVLFSTSYTSIPTPEHPYGYTWENKLLIDLSTGIDDSVWIRGGKTGYSRFVGQNLTTFAEIDGEMFLVVTMGADGSPYNGDLAHHDDHRRIWNDLAEIIREGKIFRLELPEEEAALPEEDSMPGETEETSGREEQSLPENEAESESSETE